MKSIIIISFFVLITSYSKGQNQSDTILKRIDQLERKIDEFNHQPNDLENDTLLLTIEHLEKLARSLDNDESIWKDILPSIIAVLVVLISAGSAYSIGVRQIQTQTTNAEKQLRSQEAQAQDQLRVAREQIQETSWMTIAQVRANNTSQARINWIQDLRNELCQYMEEVSFINYYLTEGFEYFKKDNREKKEKLFNEFVERIHKADQYSSKIRLFLNKEEADHMKLENLLKEFHKAAIEDISNVNVDINIISNNIIELSRKILKDAWEQAKNEGANNENHDASKK